MSDIPKLKKQSERRNINIVIDKRIDDLYRLAKQNGYNASEIARQAVTKVFTEIENQIKRPAS